MKDKSPPITTSLGSGIKSNTKGHSSPKTPAKARILLVVSDPALRRLTSTRLDAANYQTESLETAQAALDECVRKRPHLVITDLHLEQSDGFALLRELKSRWPELTVIVLTAHATIPTAVEATRCGAFSYLVKPVEKVELLDHVERAIATSAFTRANRDWQGDLATRSRLMDDRIALLNKAARSDAPVLLTGESGTGKDLLARAIHAASPRRAKPFVSVSCRTAVEPWLERELFGGEVSNASSDVPSRSDRPGSDRDGSLFVDEIGNLPLRLQGRFYEALGGARLICTTSCDLRKLVNIGQLSKELFEQINVLPVETPPLGRRREDIPLLISHFLEQATDPIDERRIYSPKAIELLATTDWPENVRQLFGLVKQNVALSQTRIADEKSQSGIPTFAEARDNSAKEYLIANLQMTQGNVSKAARLAKRNRTDFYKLLARYRLQPEDFKDTRI